MAQNSTQVLSYALISFVIAGQTRMTVNARTQNNPGPYLALLPKGSKLAFQYTEQRDQWAIALEFPGLTQGSQPDTVELTEDTDGGRVVLPMFTPITKEHISGWEGEFLRLREAFNTPCPANRVRVQTGIGNVIRYVIDQHPDIYPSAAAKLRWLIDEDRQANLGLEELSRRCGYSPSRLRVLFEREYGQSPQTYRNKRRMNIAADLLCNSDLRIKEVSERVGCHHVSHFCALFQNTYNMTPTQYQREFRQI
jgi:AraC-like DNA-binding protein